MQRQSLPPRLERALESWRRREPALAAPPRVERRLPGGRRNRSWLVDTDRRAVVRLNSPHDARFNIDRHRERIILRHLAGEPFLPEVWYCEPADGLLVTAYVEGEPLPPSAADDPAVRQQVETILERLKQISPPLPRFDYWQHLRHYRDGIHALDLTIPRELEALYEDNAGRLRRFAAADWEPTLVHHDLTPANLVVSDAGLVLVDWEYAAAGYAGMDRLLWRDGSLAYPEEVAVYSRLINGYWELLASVD